MSVTERPYDFAQRLSDLSSAWVSQQRPIAAEILSQIARIAEARDRLNEENERMLAVLRGEGWLLPTERASAEWLAAYETSRSHEKPA